MKRVAATRKIRNMHRTRDESRLGAQQQPAGLLERRGQRYLALDAGLSLERGILCYFRLTHHIVDGRRLGGLGDYGFVRLIANKLDLKASYCVPVCACHPSLWKADLPGYCSCMSWLQGWPSQGREEGKAKEPAKRQRKGERDGSCRQSVLVSCPLNIF